MDFSYTEIDSVTQNGLAVTHFNFNPNMDKQLRNYKVSNEINSPFKNFNGAAVEDWK